MTADYSQVILAQRDNACYITINRAAEHNTMTDVVMDELVRALRQAETMAGVRAIVLTGAGEQTFCAGGKLKPTADGSPFALEPGRFDNPGPWTAVICRSSPESMAVHLAAAWDSSALATLQLPWTAPNLERLKPKSAFSR